MTIQPEFIPVTPSASVASLTASSRCLVECQSLECAPKTCCSTDNLLEAVVIDNKKQKKCKHKKYLKKAVALKGPDGSESKQKCRSFLSLNVTSLTNLVKLGGGKSVSTTASSNDMKKSISESHVADLSMDPNGGRRGGSKRFSDASLTESCTSECEQDDCGDGDSGMASVPLSSVDTNLNVHEVTTMATIATAPPAIKLHSDEIPEKFRTNFAKKLEAENKAKNDDARDDDGEGNGLLMGGSSGGDGGDDGNAIVSMTQEAANVEHVAIATDGDATPSPLAGHAADEAKEESTK